MTEAAPFEDEIAAFELADAEAEPPKNAILFLGSSSLRLWENLRRDMAGFDVVNRGFGGSQIAHSTFYAPRIVWPHQPRLLVFYAGDNDLADGKSPEQVLADFQAFAESVRENLPGTSIAFVSIKPSPARIELKSKARKANALIRTWIEERAGERMRFVDVWTPMLDDVGSPRRTLFGPDLLHMNPRGYALWTPIVRAHIEAVVGAPAAKE